MTEDRPQRKRLFERVVSLVQSSSPDDYIPDDIKLELYGLYKRCTTGRTTDSGTSVPSMWNIVANRKFNAWKKCDDLDLDEAREQYVYTVSSLHNTTGSQCKDLCNDIKAGKEIGSSGKVSSTSYDDCKDSVLSISPMKPSVFQTLTGIKPFIPRGELDITYRDLLHALLRCIKPPSPFFEAPMRATVRLEEGIAKVWNEYSSNNFQVVTGLSVRSLVDVHLSSKSYPEGSEVVIVPPIGIEGMMDVIQYHGIKIVPIDIGDYANEPIVHVDIETVKKKLNDNTVAILVVHPFGLICMDDAEMKTLRNTVDNYSGKNNIEIWEDCAECFAGSDGYLGSQFANVHFFSFGMIKTATALGGGICVLNNNLDEGADALSVQMRRIQHTLHGQQTGREFFAKISKAFLLRIFARNDALIGILVWLMNLLRIDYDSIVTSAVKGFPAQKSKGHKSSVSELNEEKRVRAIKLVQRLRNRPHPALLSLLHRRIKSATTSKIVFKRKERCAKMRGLLKQFIPSLQMPEGNDSSQHLYWLFPLITNNPDETYEEMKKHGYDIPRGTSQLGCVTKYLFEEDKDINLCPNTFRMMNQISYLPIASRDMSDIEMRNLVQKLRTHVIGDTKYHLKGRKLDKSVKLTAAMYGLNVAAIIVLNAFTIRPVCWVKAFLTLLITKILPFGVIVFFAAIMALIILRIAIGPYYLKCSKAFSRYSSILSHRHLKKNDDKSYEMSVLSGSGASIIDGAASHDQAFDLEQFCALEANAFSGDDEPKQVLVTGATGFIGSLLLRELLLHRQQLSIGGGVVLICRSKRNVSAKERVRVLLRKDMFSFLDDEEKENLVTVFEGDVSRPRLGMSEVDHHAVCNDLNITHVINSAACVNFEEPLLSAAQSNITSALQLQALTKKLKKNSAKYVYLSTAFVHGNKTGSAESPLQEDLFDFGKYDPLELYQSMMGTESCASAAMNDLEFPNTYTFSKSICEHLLLRDKQVRTIIMRPCIVGPAVQVPHEGWAGERPSTLTAGACLYLNSPYNIWSFRRERAAVIPVDVVCRFIIAKAFEVSECDQTITSDDRSNGSSSFDSGSSAQVSEHSSEESYIFPKDPIIRDQYTKPLSPQSKKCSEGEGNRIFTIAWNSSSPASSNFQWFDFACAIVQLGSANNHVERTTAYMVILLSFKIFLAMDLTLENFRKVHRVLVHWPLNFVKGTCEILRLRPKFLRSFEKLEPFLDLPLLFFPFTSSSFHFESDLQTPTTFNAERYMFSCVLAAEKFVISLRNRIETKPQAESTSPIFDDNRIIIAGQRGPRPLSDLLWCIMQPQGNFAIRFTGLIVIKLLRSITSEVTIDVESFGTIMRAIKEAQSSANSNVDDKTFIVLAPTHRSFLDFIILSFISFQLPELRITIPNIAAADDFSRVPLLGIMTRMAGAFFVRRGKGIADPALQAKIRSLKNKDSLDNPTCFEVFLEGRRSRDRRFVKPKTGFLRCLIDTKGKHIVVPITINYEALPEQSGLANEAEGCSRTKMSLLRLLKWFKTVRSQEINMGRIHVSASSPILMKECPDLDIKQVANAVQLLQRRRIIVSKCHMIACASILETRLDTVYNSLKLLGCNFWSENELEVQSPAVPTSATEQWTLFLHFSHYYAPHLSASYRKWAEWLNGCHTDCLEPLLTSDEHTFIVVNSLEAMFKRADEAIELTLSMLNRKGFQNPSSGHVLQYTQDNNPNVPKLLLQVAISTNLKNIPLETKVEGADSPVMAIFGEIKNTENGSSSNESFGAWGYKDSGFILNVDSNGSKIVVMKGDRYKISNRPMPKLVPFLESETKTEVDPLRVALPRIPKISIPSTDLSSTDIDKLQKLVADDVNGVSVTDIDRARHGTGHSQEDMYMIRNDNLSQMRLPDAVIYPAKESEVESLVAVAIVEGWCLIPFGGGTNVCHATWCPPKNKDPRPMISVDMRRMNKILAINEEDSTMHVQAGITGGDLINEMTARGFTIGHEPDSIEFSTLGGWIATKASGMKQNKYGNIEGIVREVRVVSSKGKLWQHGLNDCASFARVSTGTDLTALMIGSEGSLGIITSAVIKIWPLPKRKSYDSIILHKFEDGIRLMKDVSKLGALKPASIRLLDNTQFRLGQAMKSKESFTSDIKSKCKKVVAGLFADSFDSNEMVCATITFEGSEREVKLQSQEIRSLAAKHGGLCAGSEIGRAGYDMTYAIAYIRDFAMTYGFLAESFETFVPWSKVTSLIVATKDRLRAEHYDRALPGNPIITCRVTQLYDEGVCVYFYFCMNFKHVNDPSAVFADIELAAREEIMKNGGSLSHHHGVGKHRAPLMDRVNSESLCEVFKNFKNSIDPKNVFGVSNGTYAT